MPYANAAEVQRWLEEVPVLANLADSKELEAVKELVGNPGFRLFLGLLLGSRQALYVQLAAIRIAGFSEATTASVIQGQIKGIELTRQTVLELFMSVDEKESQGARP